MSTLRLFGAALKKFNRDQGLFLASGIAFQVLLCLLPFVLLLISFAGSYLFSHERVVEQIGLYLQQAAPTLDEDLRETILDIVDHRGTLGVVGTVGLLWVATTVFGWLRIALDTIYEVADPPSTLRGLLRDLGMMALLGVTFLAGIVLSGAIEYWRRAPVAFFPAAKEPLLNALLTYVLPFLVVVLTCFLIYFVVPNRRGSRRAALQGAVFTGVLWETAKHLFAWYVSVSRSYSLVYGSLSAAVVLLVWIYYSTAVLLLGAEVAALLERRENAK